MNEDLIVKPITYQNLPLSSAAIEALGIDEIKTLKRSAMADAARHKGLSILGAVAFAVWGTTTGYVLTDKENNDQKEIAATIIGCLTTAAGIGAFVAEKAQKSSERQARELDIIELVKTNDISSVDILTAKEANGLMKANGRNVFRYSAGVTKDAPEPRNGGCVIA